MATLYHWDLPAALDDRGGWLNRDSADWFADYASVMFKRLDDRIGHWVTLNEPWVITDGGYLHGVLAPGHRNRFETPIASHNLMRAHGQAVQAYRAMANRQQIGLVVNIEPKHPATASEADAKACARAHAYMNEQYLDAALLGRYPAALRTEVFGEAWPDWPAADMAQIRQPLDFVGINYYTRGVTKHDDTLWPLFASPVRQPRSTYTETGWEVHAAALTETLTWFKQRYGDIPLYVTENGAAFFDPPTVDDGGAGGPAARALLPRPHRGGARGDGRRRRRARLFRVVAVRQPRVGARLLEALRHRPRRLRDPEAHPEAQCEVLLERHRQPWRGARSRRACNSGRISGCLPGLHPGVAAATLSRNANSVDISHQFHSWKGFHGDNSAIQVRGLTACHAFNQKHFRGQRMAATTIRDVAKLAQVSVATVSRALNGHESVTPETRQRVIDAAAELHFSPSSAARSLITRRTQTVGAVLPDLHGEYLSELIRGIEVAARARDLHLLVASAPSDPAEIAAVLRVMRGRVDGLIVMSPHGDADTIDDNLPAGLPAVLLNTRPDATRHASFAVDHRGGAAAMTRHLVEQGHRSIAFIAGPVADFAAQERLRGFHEALAQALPGAIATVLQGDFSERSGWQAGREITAMRERPSAVFAASDMMAVGCMAALDEAGVKVPRRRRARRLRRHPDRAVHASCTEHGPRGDRRFGCARARAARFRHRDRTNNAQCATQDRAGRSGRAAKLRADDHSLALNRTMEASMEREDTTTGGPDGRRRALLLAAAGTGALAALPGARADSYLAAMSLPDPNAVLDDLAERTFRFFWETTDPMTGLAPDRWPTPSCCSVAAVGFALTAYPIGAARGWITRGEARQRVLTTLRFLNSAPQGPERSGRAGYKGFFYHFLDMKTGARYGKSELSTVDTALLLAGALFCQSWFNEGDKGETEIRELAEQLCTRVDWRWAQVRGSAITLGWRPESGFLPYDWKGYNEAMILYLIALGAPKDPIDAPAWGSWTSTYDAVSWGQIHGQKHHLGFAPLFGHQYSHCWVDFRGIRDDYMRMRGLDYFENSRRATYAQRAYAVANPLGWKGYGPEVWGITACDGPADVRLTYRDSTRRFRSYAGRGAGGVHTRDDGTLAPTAAAASLPFAPEVVIPAVATMRTQWGENLYSKYGFVDSFNPSFDFKVPLRHGRVVQGAGWFDTDYLGIDQGPIVAMLANYRDDLVWKTMRGNAHLQRGLKRAGFTGGWLEV